MRNEINRGPDIWADVETGHLPPDKRWEADRSKAELVERQRQRVMLRSPFDTGKIPVRDKVIEDMESFRSLCRAGLEVVKKGPTVVVMETRGRSNLWVTARKRLDGDDYFKNDESSGVTIILLNIMNRFGEDIIGFVNIKKIINDELNGDPCVCPEFVELISAKKVTVWPRKLEAILSQRPGYL